MNSRRDPIELLGAAKPADSYLEPGADPFADSLLDDIMSAESGSVSRGRWRRRRIVGVSVVAVAVSAGTVAAIVATRSQPDDLVTLGCWSEAIAPRAAEVVVVGWDGSDPTDVCSTVWASNGFDTIETSETPALVACVTGAGSVAVVPGVDEAVCAAVGLTIFDDVADPDVDATRVAIEQIEAALTEEACLPLESAIDTVEQIFANNALTDWTITPPDPSPDDGVCITAGIDPTSRTVFLVPGV